MIKPTDPKEYKKVNKGRGFFFHNEIHVPMSRKYNISLSAVDTLRKYGIHYKLNREQSLERILDGFSRGVYKKKDISVKKTRLETLRFLKKCTDEEYKEITVKTKYDWD